MLRSTAEANQSPSPDPGELTLRSLFEREEGNLLRYAFSLTGRRAVAEEIVQEVFLQLHARWCEIQSPQAWLVRCVRNRSYDYLRRSKHELLHGDRGDENRSQAHQLDPRSADVSSLAKSKVEAPETELIKMESVAALRNVLAELKPSDRELIRLKYFEGLKYREISERTGMTVSNVGFRLHYLLKDLAGRLPGLGVEQ